MFLALLFSLQTTAATAPPAAAEPLDIDFDLATYKPSYPSGCALGTSSDIVVCGARRPAGAYPLEEMARIFEPRPLVAQTRLFGSVRGRAYVESVGMPQGQVSKRAMVGIKLGF